MRIAIVLGTRPEIIKLSPVVRAISAKATIKSLLIHTNQHYDRELDAIFFEELELAAPDFELAIGSHSHGRQVGLMLTAIEEVLMAQRPDAVIVQGDTNSTFAGALAATRLQIPVAHVEAGLRSFDMAMPEEVNRVMTDHISSVLFAPTQKAAGNLRAEGITRQVHVVGNTVVDALSHHLDAATAAGRDGPWASGYQYLLATVHRDSNTDSKERLEELLAAFQQVHKESGLDVVLPAHPRLTDRLRRCGLLDRAQGLTGVRILEPLGYLEFIVALKHARAVLTDSGGVQEEACVMGVPCVTLGNSTERQETLEVGANVLAPTGPEAVAAVKAALNLRQRTWPNPFGQGDAGERIVDVLVRELL